MTLVRGWAFVLAIVCAADAMAQASDRYDDLFRSYSKKYFGPAFDWRVFKAQAIAESGLDPHAQSWVAAKGLMQLMPATYREVQSSNPGLGEITDPRWNIAAGIFYDRQMWVRWTEMGNDTVHRRSFMFASYNAGRGTLLRAQRVATERALNHNQWQNIETVAPAVPRWRYEETLGYVGKILAGIDRMDEKGRLLRRQVATASRPQPPQAPVPRPPAAGS